MQNAMFESSAGDNNKDSLRSPHGCLYNSSDIWYLYKLNRCIVSSIRTGASSLVKGSDGLRTDCWLPFIPAWLRGSIVTCDIFIKSQSQLDTYIALIFDKVVCPIHVVTSHQFTWSNFPISPKASCSIRVGHQPARDPLSDQQAINSISCLPGHVKMSFLVDRWHCGRRIVAIIVRTK